LVVSVTEREAICRDDPGIFLEKFLSKKLYRIPFQTCGQAIV
jgi:hypothetical protein